jgi:transcriptional regulator with XRE-family HTH domain
MRQTNAGSPRQVFGAMLGYYRSSAGLSPEQLGARIFLSGSQIRKIEAGRRTATRSLATACEGIPELGCNGALTELYDQLSEFLKQHAYPGWFEEWPDKEILASRLRSFEPMLIPGLLQTEAYARAILSTKVGMTAEDLDEAVAARTERQQILTMGKPPEFWGILDEAVLRRPVGTPAVMRGQMRFLAEAARLPHVVIQVIPLTAGAHEGLRGAGFIVADFDDASPIAYQDTATAGQIIDEPSQISSLAVTWDTLRLEALPQAASINLIEEAAEQ